MKKPTWLLNLVTIAIALACTGCGKGTGFGAPPAPPAPPESVELRVGSDFLSTPGNEIRFQRLRPRESQLKYLQFRARQRGRFVLGLSYYALGIGCVNGEDQAHYSLSYQYFVRGPGTGGAFQARELDETATESPLAYLSLEEGDELRVTMRIDGQMECASATVFLHAIFQPPVFRQ